MPFEDGVSLLQDILDSVEAIQRFVAGMDIESFRCDEKAAPQLSASSRSSAKLPFGLATGPLKYARNFHGAIFAASETGCDINTMR